MGRPLCPQISKLSICQRLSKNCECVLKLPKMAKKCQSLSRIVKSGKKKCQKLIDVAKVIQNCQRLAKKMSVLDLLKSLKESSLDHFLLGLSRRQEWLLGRRRFHNLFRKDFNTSQKIYRAKMLMM